MKLARIKEGVLGLGRFKAGCCYPIKAENTPSTIIIRMNDDNVTVLYRVSGNMQ